MIDDARAALGTRELKVTLPAREVLAAPLNNYEIIVQGTKQKCLILQEYKEKFGTEYPDSIITKKKGKHSSINPAQKVVRMRPSIQKTVPLIATPNEDTQFEDKVTKGEKGKGLHYRLHMEECLPFFLVMIESG